MEFSSMEHYKGYNRNETDAFNRWKSQECSSSKMGAAAETNMDVVRKFHLLFKSIIREKKIKNKWELYEFVEVMNKETLENKLAKIFYKLR
jgi:hypothetical protein